MKMFEAVVLACDQSSLDVALAIRGALELFRLPVYMHFCVQKRNVLDVLAGHIPESRYVVLCCHGTDDPPSAPGPSQVSMGFHVVDDATGMWETTWFNLTPANVSAFVRLPGRTVVALGCGTGREPLARAFLRTGCRAYVGAEKPVDQDACALFAISFFYHLLGEDRPGARACSEQEAAQLAAQADPNCPEGTSVFRYYAEA
jgi:hypothetical protein